jgi:hypothetical protein
VGSQGTVLLHAVRGAARRCVMGVVPVNVAGSVFCWPQIPVNCPLWFKG